MIRRTLILLITAGPLIAFIWATGGETHRSGRHRWHSCPSDTGSYVCGDLGDCSKCSHG